MEAVRALLLTDIVDSTKLSEQLGNRAMGDVWAAHDRVARDLLPMWHGHEIDKTDGMLLMFDSPSDALHYALAYQQALAKLPVVLKARAGLHVGPVLLRKNGPEDVARGAKPLEVEGLTKPTAARVMALALGGQTLITDDVRQALSQGAWTLQSHGHWILKGLAEPLELFEAGLDAHAFVAPPDGEKAYRVARVGGQWLPVRQMANNLPQQTTSFVGRERERQQIRAALEHSRLVTLVGMGGLGKTRLSLRVAAEVMMWFPDGVWFLDLAPVRDPALVVGEAAQILGVREEPDKPLLQTLLTTLKRRRTLLIFDNCEHLIQASADLANAILRAAPQVSILATSREALHVPGEQSCPVLPLPLPERDAGLEALSRSTAVRLFVERAQSHKPEFALNEREGPAVAQLVALLEGIPLALELAAARVRAMSVSELNARLDDRYKVLTAGGRVLLQRQQTLRALVDWSYDLLDVSERILLNRLAVFVGGFDLGAAEQVCGAEPLQPADVLDLVTSLVEKSLVMTDEGERGTRYRMLETIREYAWEKLVQEGGAATIGARHCQHYFAFAKASNRGLRGSEQGSWIARVEAEVDNVRAGIALALAGGVDPIIAVKYAVAMQGFWIMRGYASEGRTTVHAALELSSIQSSEAAMGHALYVGAALAESQSDFTQARSMLERCLALRRALGDPIDIAATLSTLSWARFRTGDIDLARAGEEEALTIFREQGDRFGEAIVLLHLGQIAIWLGNDAQAQTHVKTSLALAQQLEHREIEAECELVVGQLEVENGAPHRARERFMRSLAISREAADKRGEANALWWLSKVDLRDRAIEVAGARLIESLRAFRTFEMRMELLGCLEDCAVLASLGARNGLAVQLAAAAAASRERLSLIRAPFGERDWQRHLAALRTAMGDTSFQTAWNEGRQIGINEAIQLAEKDLKGLSQLTSV
ncbi:MAG TPA: tetratricopeptide repeat protein [Burkholderiaceae bacterium]|nr:tetratricopeptide repeat protein [Burkholderiaceae bacterium]